MHLFARGCETARGSAAWSTARSERESCVKDFSLTVDTREPLDTDLSISSQEQRSVRSTVASKIESANEDLNPRRSRSSSGVPCRVAMLRRRDFFQARSRHVGSRLRFGSRDFGVWAALTMLQKSLPMISQMSVPPGGY